MIEHGQRHGVAELVMNDCCEFAGRASLYKLRRESQNDEMKLGGWAAGKIRCSWMD
jgi:hypothetical protein